MSLLSATNCQLSTTFLHFLPITCLAVILIDIPVRSAGGGLHGYFFFVTAGGTRSRASVAPMPFSVATSATLPRRPAVAEDCDPPATRGDGALAIVSACHLPRRRGRTPLATACAAHFVRGLCRYCQLPTINYSLSTTFLHFYTAISTARAPSPLLRPLARLTSFGGYVATTRPFSTTARRRRYGRDALPRVRVFFDA